MTDATGALWTADFQFAAGRLKVLKTGADLKIDRVLVGEALVWLAFYAIVRLRLLKRLGRPKGPALWFTPDIPRPWYLIWAAAAWGGARLARSADEADAVIYFEDSTWGAPQRPTTAHAYNFRCRDISKSRVAALFEEVFGYPLALDPRAWTGPAVEKSEANGAHDGRVVDCPMEPRPGKAYQRLIDTAHEGSVIDLRTPCVGGRPVVVWRKCKPAADRFSIHNTRVESQDPRAVFSSLELDQIGRFAAAIGMDWGGLDILRSQADGRIYIVDANKTDVGPVIALPLRSKLQATRLLADALLAMVASPTRAPAEEPARTPSAVSQCAPASAC